MVSKGKKTKYWQRNRKSERLRMKKKYALRKQGQLENILSQDECDGCGKPNPCHYWGNLCIMEYAVFHKDCARLMRRDGFLRRGAKVKRLSDLRKAQEA